SRVHRADAAERDPPRAAGGGLCGLGLRHQPARLGKRARGDDGHRLLALPAGAAGRLFRPRCHPHGRGPRPCPRAGKPDQACRTAGRDRRERRLAVPDRGDIPASRERDHLLHPRDKPAGRTRGHLPDRCPHAGPADDLHRRSRAAGEKRDGAEARDVRGDGPDACHGDGVAFGHALCRFLLRSRRAHRRRGRPAALGGGTADARPPRRVGRQPGRLRDDRGGDAGGGARAHRPPLPRARLGAHRLRHAPHRRLQPLRPLAADRALGRAPRLRPVPRQRRDEPRRPLVLGLARDLPAGGGRARDRRRPARARGPGATRAPRPRRGGGLMTLALYIARRFAKTVLTVFAGFFVLLYLIDMIEQIRRFADADISLGAAAELAALNTPQAVYRILPMILILASIALFLALARSSELVVIRAAGRSALRMLLAPLVTTLLIGAVAVALLNPIVAGTAKR